MFQFIKTRFGVKTVEMQNKLIRIIIDQQGEKSY